MVSKVTINRGRSLGTEGPALAAQHWPLQGPRGRGGGAQCGEAAHGEGRMRGRCSVLLLSAGELGATHRDSATWYRQEGGPVCSWLRKPQPREPRTSSPVPWTWARHSESRPPGTLPWSGPASALPDGAHAGGKCSDGSPASARSLGGAFESLAHSTHAQGATELPPLGPSHPSALDDALPQDGEAHCCPPILAPGGSGEDEKTGWREWGSGEER